ncbi:response regulator [Egicoccus sp. AB-alg2]|uniref:response regulator n=1 Tax=Egicoccus sp. AB-alg2 TaxID=3242693 RepID=UPI00359D5370
MTLPPTRIVIADDHARVREQTRRILEPAGFEVVGEAADASQAVDQVVSLRPDLALLDVRMPGGGLRAAAEIAVAAPTVLVVMFTVSESRDDLLAALRVGAVGYLLKDTDPARLPLALKGAISGEAAIPRHLVLPVIQAFRLRPHPARLRVNGRHDVALTGREWDVAELLREGLTTREIAERLVVSHGTVRTHVSALVHKLGANDREDLRRRLRGV